MALCAERFCDNKAAPRSKFCSLACADKCVVELLKRIRESKSRFSAAEIEASGYVGEASPVALRGLRNPFREKSAAHEAFEILRIASLGDGINRELFIDLLERRCLRGNVQLRSPRERVRRTISEIRSKGYELSKDEAGRFRLTGRRVN